MVSRFCRNTDAQLLLYQARCLHHEQNNAGAQRLLLQALHLAPHDQVLRFDIALQVQVQALTKYRPSQAPECGKQETPKQVPPAAMCLTRCQA